MKQRIMFLDGNYLSEQKAVIPITAHALHYGSGCFEGIRAYFSEKDKCLYVFRMREHYQRLLRSCKILFIDIPYTAEELCDITIKLLKKNFSETDIYIRPLAFKSDTSVGNFNLKTLKNSLAVYTVPMGRYLNTEKGIRCNISSFTRVPDNSIPARGKITGAYVNTSLAKTESLLTGYDEALFLNEHHHVVEGSAENLFIVKNGEVVTPPVHDDILEGITRDTVIKICRQELSLEVKERSIDRSEIYQMEEVFLVGTGAEVSPVIEIDGRKIGNGKIGKISAEVKRIYNLLVRGEYDKHIQFLTKVTV